jgi:alkylation response protein AidB-like acyl-CoA dehydrogenase
MLDEVRVPVANLIGEQDKGWTYAKFLLGYERTNMAGIPQAKRALRRVKTIAAKEMDGGRPLIENQRFRHRIADTEIQIMALEATTLKLLADQVAGKTPGPEASFIKIRGTEIDQALTELTMDAVGNYALPFIPEALDDGWNEEPVGPDYAMPAAPEYFNTRKVTIYGGSNEIQKNIIAKAVLGL